MSETERQGLIALLSGHREQVRLLCEQAAVIARSGERTALRIHIEAQVVRRRVDIALLESRLGLHA